MVTRRPVGEYVARTATGRAGPVLLRSVHRWESPYTSGASMAAATRRMLPPLPAESQPSKHGD